MEQPMDKLQTMLQGYMAGLALLAAGAMQMELMYTIVTNGKERLTQALGHEPTQENWEDYWELLKERALKQTNPSRSEEREKIRRLLTGDEDASAETK